MEVKRTWRLLGDGRKAIMVLMVGRWRRADKVENFVIEIFLEEM